MTRAALERVSQRIQELRSRPFSIRSRELIGIAESMGRTRKKKRSGEPAWDSEFRGWPVIFIPCHPKPLKPKTASRILDYLEEDMERWEQKLDNHEAGNGKDETRH